MKLYVYILLILLLMEGLQSCITPFMPDDLDTSGGVLVVEGDILANDTTVVFLSYSLALDDDNKIIYETNAKVWVESETGTKYTGELRSPSGKAPYFAVNTTSLDLADNYKLCVQLLNGKNYASDLMPVLVTPPIDSVNYVVDDTQSEVTFYVNTHGSDNDSRYYKWRYQEDWEFSSYYFTYYYYDPNTDEVLKFQNGENTYWCWDSAHSSDILVTQTNDLEENTVYRMKLTSFTGKDRRASYLYSILVHQFSISPEAYKYWSTLKKNSDAMGGIFAPQPSETLGNIHCLSNPAEKVLGYVSASMAASKRIFVDRSELKIYENSFFCFPYEPDPFGEPMPPEVLYGLNYRVIEIDDKGEVIWGRLSCVDCRYYGSKNKPPFWPNNHK